jgi:long-subunit acyl-CoA synthetase (AMP-forming)
MKNYRETYVRKAGTSGRFNDRRRTGPGSRCGKTGEILIRGPLVFEGYWGEEELTKHTFRDGWHHTGDIGCLDEEGFLWFVDSLPKKEDGSIDRAKVKEMHG